MHSILAFIIRTSAFFRKEITEVLRQPRLILTLVLGPFLILFIFGIGYKNEPRAVRTIFVVPPNAQYANQIKSYATSISPQLVFQGVTTDKGAALQQLANGNIDLVVVAPSNAFETIQNNQQAVFQLYDNEIDPAQVGYINYLGEVLIGEVNRRIISSITAQGQSEASSVQSQLQSAQQNVRAMKQALQTGNIQSAQQYQTQMKQNISTIALAMGTSAGLLGGIQNNLGPGTNSNDPQQLAALLNDLQKNANNSATPQSTDSTYASEIQRLNKMDTDLTSLNQQLGTFQKISPAVLISPFRVETQTITAIQPTPLDFFTPAVIILLLQHFGVTIAALSIVREQRSGAMELFRVSPVTAGETILGKYLSYLVFGGLVAAILTLLITFGLKVPMLGNWLNFALVILATIFAALGLGFLISLNAGTESQAVQLAMIALLLSVFFSGFILDLRYFWPPVRVISYLIPATYGIILLQNIMLRGSGILLIYIGGLLLIGVILFILTWFLIRRRMAHR